jgi:hypothetical protein
VIDVVLGASVTVLVRRTVIRLFFVFGSPLVRRQPSRVSLGARLDPGVLLDEAEDLGEPLLAPTWPGEITNASPALNSHPLSP